jgi:hypothetical protein
MQILTDTIDGALWHRVIPETEQETDLAKEILIPDNTGSFLDMGDANIWKQFQDNINNN